MVVLCDAHIQVNAGTLVNGVTYLHMQSVIRHLACHQALSVLEMLHVFCKLFGYIAQISKAVARCSYHMFPHSLTYCCLLCVFSATICRPAVYQEYTAPCLCLHNKRTDSRLQHMQTSLVMCPQHTLSSSLVCS